MKLLYCLVFLSGIFATTFADPSFIVNGNEVNDEQLRLQWDSLMFSEGEVLKATVNEYSDKLMANLDVMLKADGADPLFLPDVEVQLKETILFIHYKGTLKLTSISVDGLSLLQRSGDSTVTYDIRSKKARFDIPLKLNEIDITCHFKAKLPPFSSHGRLTGEMKNVEMLTSIEVDFKEFKASVLGYKITDSGSIKLHFHVGKLIDWLMNLIGDAATSIFESKINKEIDTVVTEAMQKIVDVVNQIISLFIDNPTI